jgi:hypothetical protein
MARFYFHLRKGAEFHTDPEGTDLNDISEARREPSWPRVKSWRKRSGLVATACPRRS